MRSTFRCTRSECFGRSQRAQHPALRGIDAEIYAISVSGLQGQESSVSGRRVYSIGRVVTFVGDVIT